jgi:hypothetical protein
MLKHIAYGATLVVGVVVSGAAGAEPISSCKPVIKAVAETADSKMTTRIGALPDGWVQQEYFASCDVDGKPYTTLIQVRRPADAAKASGLVMAEVWHWGDIWTVYPKIWPYLARKNDATVFILGNPVAMEGIRKRDPARYASLSLPFAGDRGKPVPLEYEVLTQLGAAIKSGAIPGLKVRKMLMAGMSGSGGQVRHYMIQEGKATLPDGKPVFDGFFPAETAISSAEAPVPDLPVPTVEIQGETELLRSFQTGGHNAAYRRPDGPLYRLYEVPGMSHISTRGPAPEFEHRWNCGTMTLSDFPQEGVYRAAFDSLVRWVDKGIPAPHAPRISTNADGSVISRDAYGNAEGGLRTVLLDVPVAKIDVTSGAVPQGHAQAEMPRCDMIGHLTPLDAGELKRLYPSHAVYVRKFDSRLKTLIAGHWYLAEDADDLRKQAVAAAVPPQ